MIRITPAIAIAEQELTWQAVRAQGPGGQHVNKVATAVQLRFDVRASSLPLACQERLLALQDSRISADGIVVIKAGQHRSQARNREEAVDRLVALIRQALVVRKPRKASRVPASAQKRRVDRKVLHGRTKALRGKPSITN